MTPLLYGQPIFAVKNDTCSVVGNEVLFRMEVGDERKIIGPTEMLTLIGPAQVYSLMDAGVMRLLNAETCLPCTGKLFLNLAPETITNCELRSVWLKALETLCSKAEEVIVEFSERMADAQAARDMVSACRERGARVALDDYTGSTPVSRELLHGAHWDYIKLCDHALQKTQVDLSRLLATLRFAAPKARVVFERFEPEAIRRLNTRYPGSLFQSFCLGVPKPLASAKASVLRLGPEARRANAITG